MRLCGNGENGVSQKLSECRERELSSLHIFMLKALVVYKRCKLCEEILGLDSNLITFLDASFIIYQCRCFPLQVIQIISYGRFLYFRVAHGLISSSRILESIRDC